MQEKELIALLKKRDEKGIKELLLHYGPLMRYVIAPILLNPQDREDCLSEITMRIWEKSIPLMKIVEIGIVGLRH